MEFLLGYFLGYVVARLISVYAHRAMMRRVFEQLAEADRQHKLDLLMGRTTHAKADRTTHGKGEGEVPGQGQLF